jgi:1-acyl-sn-glycerol-3-phosphate acyltransferase
LYFPEGGVPDDESILLDTFKDGAFRLAIEHQIPIVPSRLPIIKAIFLFFQRKPRYYACQNA